MIELAINGGRPVRTKPFPAQITVGDEEKNAINNFLSKEIKILSGFRGNWQSAFYGGEQVKEFEKQFSEKFYVKHSLAVNSCTSALQIACGAIGLQPGDEVIVTPWSMSCSASAPLIYDAIPIFADIDDYYCLDPDSVESKITERTKAIIAVDLFGQPFDVRIMDIAKKYNLYVIEDAAQAIGSKYKDQYAGTIGHIGCFSFTQGKHLTCGEGGMITTNDDELAFKCSLIRNHAESVINAMPEKIQNKAKNYPNMIGFNMRMTELQAVIMQEQLKKLDSFIEMRIKNIITIGDKIYTIPSIKTKYFPRNYHIENNIDYTHSYYVQGFEWENEEIHRDVFIKAVAAELSGEEGRPDKPMIGCGYIKPLYLMPLFQGGFTQLFGGLKMKYIYEMGDCPNAEKLWKDKFFLSMYHNLPLSNQDMRDISKAFNKVWHNKNELI